MTCVTDCPYTAVGKKWNDRHKLMFDGDDSVTVRLFPSPKTGMHKEENVDFRFTNEHPAHSMKSTVHFCFGQEH